MRKGFEHRSLTPMKHWSAHLLPSEISVIEVAVGSLHMFDSPAGHAICELQGIRIVIGEKRQRIYGLRSALNINRQQTIMHILRTTIALKKSLLEICITTRQVFGEFAVVRAIDIALQTVQ